MVSAFFLSKFKVAVFFAERFFGDWAGFVFSRSAVVLGLFQTSPSMLPIAFAFPPARRYHDAFVENTGAVVASFLIGTLVFVPSKGVL
ncbi:hypothetical protein [Acanthopleuribacter pedis]|uniref:Uncharacterized protein n=1 Tax=Acanthopleuribacter pedis TaxID=442870 RepID=A0A8J7QEF5_9BACT|nr:hypothetical protein [Acanthopleuribacter pedis]MBO1322399.1 hypothetical protein [Acanthopleuribacter pedis]